MSELGVKVISKGYDVLLRRQLETGQKISLESLVEQTNMARATIRRVLADKDADISGVSIQVIAEAARLLGVDSRDMYEVQPNPAGIPKVKADE